MRKSKKNFARLALVCLALAAILYINNRNPNGKIVGKTEGNLLDRSFSFGTPEGVYSHDIALELRTNLPDPGWEIYYTTDGSRPTKESAKYESPLLYKIDDGLQLIQIKAVVYLDGEEVGGPYTGTFLLTRQPELLQDILVVSITSEQEGLFGAEEGILYPPESFISTGTEEGWALLHSQNFAQQGDEWVREANVTVFDGNGKTVLNQDCGISVSGSHGSLLHYPFSLKLKADKSYQEDKNVFRYDFFQEGAQLYQDGGMQYYDSISFKNGGNDYPFGTLREDIQGTMLRNTIGSRLAEEIGLLTTKQRIAIVFLNGEFYNITHLNANLNAKSIAVKTGLHKDYIITKKYPEKECFTESGLKKLYHSFPDLSDSNIFERREEFERKVDVEELFRYYAFECMVGNGDWPHNNYAMWKYIGNPDEENPYSDGKYRFWVFDTDTIYNLQEWLEDPWDAIFQDTRSENCLLPILMQIEDYRCQFVNTVYDLLNSGTFAEEHILQIIDEENSAYSPWFTWVYGEEKEEERERNVEQLKENVLQRRGQVEGYLKKYFGCESPYTLSVLPSGAAGRLHVNSLYLDGSGYTGSYDAAYPVRLTYEGSAVDRFGYWLVNGEKTEEETLVVTADMIRDGRVTVELVTGK